MVIESFKIQPPVKDKGTMNINDTTRDFIDNLSNNSLQEPQSNSKEQVGEAAAAQNHHHSQSDISKENLRMLKEMKMTGKFNIEEDGGRNNENDNKMEASKKQIDQQ